MFGTSRLGVFRVRMLLVGGSTLGPLIFSISHIAVFVAFEKSSVLESRASVAFRAV